MKYTTSQVNVNGTNEPSGRRTVPLHEIGPSMSAPNEIEADTDTGRDDVAIRGRASRKKSGPGFSTWARTKDNWSVAVFEKICNFHVPGVGELILANR